MESTEIIMWGLRLGLPLILLICYLVSQQKDMAFAKNIFAPTQHIDRATLLKYRNLININELEPDDPVAQMFSNMRLISEEEAPDLFKRKEEPLRRRDRKRLARGEDLDDNSEEKMRLECLVNYMAYCPIQHKVFLPPGPDHQPDPPLLGVKEMTPTVQRRTNEEAMLVLAGAARIKNSVVVKPLFEHLRDLQVQVNEETFKAAVEVAIKCEDMEAISEVLKQMEAAGFFPEASMLDRVMKLYKQQKNGESAAINSNTNSNKHMQPQVANNDVSNASVKSYVVQDDSTPSITTRPSMAGSNEAAEPIRAK